MEHKTKGRNGKTENINIPIKYKKKKRKKEYEKINSLTVIDAVEYVDNLMATFLIIFDRNEKVKRNPVRIVLVLFSVHNENENNHTEKGGV